jgi:hypothetical protein
MNAIRSAFVRCVVLGTIIVAAAGCGANSNGFDPSDLNSLYPNASANPNTTCSVSKEAQKTIDDVSAGNLVAVPELVQLSIDAKSLASSETGPEFSDASALSQDAYNLSHSSAGTSSAQLQGSIDFLKLTVDAENLMLDGNC